MNRNQPAPRADAAPSAEQEAAYMVWAERIERDDYEPAADGAIFVGEAATREARRLLDAIIGAAETVEPTKPGRPGLEGKAGAGPAQKRQVRLSREVDALLIQRAEAEHVDLSVVMRRAIETYLRRSA